MKRPPKRTADKARAKAMARKCIFCEKVGNLKAAAFENKNRAGISSREVYLYHQDCLDREIENKHPHAITIIEALKQTQELREKRQKFYEEKGVSAAEWYKQYKKEKGKK